METIYKTQVKQVGPLAESFLSNKMLVLFGVQAPTELADYCYIIEKTPLSDNIEHGDILKLDDKEYKIMAVGSEVSRNLSNLAHITISFKGKEEAELGGTLYLEDSELPNVNINSVIEIKKNTNTKK